LKAKVFLNNGPLLDIISNEIIQIVITIPDTADQISRIGLLTAFESYRPSHKGKTMKEVLKYLKDENFEPKRTRILNRTNALAIAYSRKLMEDTKKTPFDRKIPPLKLTIFCADKAYLYVAKFKTTFGVVYQTGYENLPYNECHHKLEYFTQNDKPSETSANKFYEEYLKRIERNTDSKILVNINEEAFDYNDSKAFSAANWNFFDDGSSLLRQKVFSTSPTLPSLNCLSLLGTDTKSRMLCGDVDYIDYDVPPVSLHEVTLTYKNVQTSVVAKFEQLPIKRTIFESDKKIDVSVEYKPPINNPEIPEKKGITKYQTIVSRSGIFAT